MPTENRTNRIIIAKIIGYCDTIADLMNELYLKKSAFQLSCNMCIIQIGELIKHLNAELKNQHTEIEWKKIISVRNIITHDYYHVDFEIMWEILTQDVPEMKANLQKIYSELLED